MTDQPDDEIQPVDWLVGAALMIRRETWQEVGPLDSQFYMYFEELDWCRRCRAMGWEIHYLPLARVVHHHNASAGQIEATSRVRFNRSKIRYFRKYFGAEWATVIRLFMLVNYAWVLGVETAKWLVDPRRKRRLHRMRAYWWASKSCLR
jgi:GT2 family glycosyltransferase